MYESVVSLVVNAPDHHCAERHIRSGDWLIDHQQAYAKIVPIAPHVVVPTAEIVDFSVLGVIPFIHEDRMEWHNGAIPHMAAVRVKMLATDMLGVEAYLASRIWLDESSGVQCIGYVMPARARVYAS